jgi:hypothetical protein
VKEKWLRVKNIKSHYDFGVPEKKEEEEPGRNEKCDLTEMRMIYVALGR